MVIFFIRWPGIKADWNDCGRWRYSDSRRIQPREPGGVSRRRYETLKQSSMCSADASSGENAGYPIQLLKFDAVFTTIAACSVWASPVWWLGWHGLRQYYTLKEPKDDPILQQAEHGKSLSTYAAKLVDNWNSHRKRHKSLDWST